MQVVKTRKIGHFAPNFLWKMVLEVGLVGEARCPYFLSIFVRRTKMVLEVGLEPTKAEAERFTVSCHCH